MPPMPTILAELFSRRPTRGLLVHNYNISVPRDFGFNSQACTGKQKNGQEDVMETKHEMGRTETERIEAWLLKVAQCRPPPS